jgi:DNA-binding XRE family transcriptional regulator
MDEREFQIKLGSLMKTIREAARLTQADVATVLNCAVNTVSRYETGKYAVSSYVLYRLDRWYGWRLLDLMRAKPKLSRVACVNCGQREDVCAEKPNGSACCRHCDHTRPYRGGPRAVPGRIHPAGGGQ